MSRLLLHCVVLALGTSTVLAAPAALAKPHENAKQVLEQTTDLRMSPTTFLVKYAPGITTDRQRFVETALGLQTVRSYDIVPGLRQVTTNLEIGDAVAIANLLPSLEYAEPDWVVHKTATPNDTYYCLQFALNNTGQSVNGSSGTADADMDCAEGWDTETGDGTLAITVIDTGVQWNHPDLDANIRSNPGEISGNGSDGDGNGCEVYSSYLEVPVTRDQPYFVKVGGYSSSLYNTIVTSQSVDHLFMADAGNSGDLDASDSISLTDLGDGQVLIDWVDPDDLGESFLIQRRIKIEGSWSAKETIATVDCSLADYVDEPGLNQVKYRVRGVNAARKSSWSRWKDICLR